MSLSDATVIVTVTVSPTLAGWLGMATVVIDGGVVSAAGGELLVTAWPVMAAGALLALSVRLPVPGL